MKIAIIGMAGRFPGAENVETFWKNLCDGKDTVARDGTIIPGQGFLKIGAFGRIENAYQFDADFFSMNEKEALETDPQERVMLQLAYHALENAGVLVNEDFNRIGIVCGAKENEYAFKRYYETGLTGIEKETSRMYLGASLATKTAYKLNFQGPALQIKATCATGLAAAHIACEMLTNGEADVMLAGAVNLSLQNQHYLYMDGGITSRDGFGRAFSEEASGCVPGDGAGMVVLKRYEDAVRDKDSVIAVIRGSALLNDGNIKMGFSAPSRTAEQRTIETALQKAGIRAEELNYLETHGTATKLGDMVELGALREIFSPEQKLTLGAVKNNIGHLNYAAGIAGLIKTALVIKHRTAPPVVNSTTVSEVVKESGFILNQEQKSFEELHPGRKLTAGVSSFGIGGNNVHMILQESEMQEITPEPEQKIVFLLSAKSQESLAEYETVMEQWLMLNTDKWVNAAYTLFAGRKAFRCRSALIGRIENGFAVIEKYIPKLSENSGTEAFALEDFSDSGLKKAVALWLKGTAFTWNALTEKQGVHKISLPGYYFCKKEYDLFRDFKEPEQETENSVSEEVPVAEAVQQIMQEVVGSPFAPDDDIDVLGIDSLSFVIISSKIEARFHVNLSSMDLYAFDTAGELQAEIIAAIEALKPDTASVADAKNPEKTDEQNIEDLLNLIS